MNDDYIELKEVMWNYRAKEGQWCKLPYPNHPNGCPNFPECIKKNQLEGYSPVELKWYAVIEIFNLAQHAYNMKLKHPRWSDRQCRCVLYWQNSVRKRLREKMNKIMESMPNAVCGTLCPEALGVNVFGTMAKVGITLYKNPDTVRKIAFIGVQE